MRTEGFDARRTLVVCRRTHTRIQALRLIVGACTRRPLTQRAERGLSSGVVPDARCPFFVFAEVLPWRREEDRREARESPSPDEAKWRARLVKAQASLPELKLRKESGELIDVVESVDELGRVLAICRARILSLRGKWAPHFIGLATMAEATAMLDQIAEDILLRRCAKEPTN